MMKKPTNLKQVTYHEQLANGIHVITYRGGRLDGRHEIDQLLVILNQLYADMPPDDHPRFLIDGSQSEARPAIPYFLSTFGAWNNDNRNRPAGSLAYMIRGESVVSRMLASIINTLPRGRDRFRVFEPHQRDAALAWLLEGSSLTGDE